MKTEEWFKIRHVSSGTLAIDDHGSDVMYLITGDKKCLHIDTGWGIGDLLKLISSFSSLPLTVMNTHGHPDHTYGNSVFNQVHIHEADKYFIDKPSSAETKSGSWKTFYRNRYPKTLPQTRGLQKCLPYKQLRMIMSSI